MIAIGADHGGYKLKEEIKRYWICRCRNIFRRKNRLSNICRKSSPKDAK